MNFNIKIKAKRLWTILACTIIGVIIASCSFKVDKVDQPYTAKVGDVIDITVDFTVVTNENPSQTGPMIFAMLMPVGWKGAENTTIEYTSTKGDGKMKHIPDSEVAAGGSGFNPGGLNWPANLKRKFGIGNNFIEDLEWVVFRSEDVTYGNNETTKGKLFIKLKVGADGNDANVRLAYVITSGRDGLVVNEFGTYYNDFYTDCLSVTGGTTGDLIDFCSPQLGIINPPKSLDNDFTTIVFDSNAATNPLQGADAVYFKGTAVTEDGQTITVDEISDKTKLTETLPGSGKFQKVIWPRKFFNISKTQKLVSLSYYITNASKSVQVGYNNTAEPFKFKFKCN
ncbi:hypothetical protein DJ568_08350 [Mucilaginibacter hurinus]|uniref:DUF4961 domain-containing protein n=1 Tax=Mucilaginibacter hurinus TaxID=2201324 RepID=A0A367GP06_9SPHI|nr:DUF4961 domain-containing protein [Mucilaginibacter hurinus]RCH55189.1 hypothetical protein DJ568_08350 [Mucilaginibacter hurinus]